MIPDFTTRLAAFAADPVIPSADALTVARLSCLDWIAVGRAGASEPLSVILRDMALEEGGRAQSHLIGSGTKVPARAAALVNGAISHALDYDDTHFAHIGHPSVAVFPAALAVGEMQGAGLDEVLEAALVGMELSVRVGLWLGRGHYQAGFHQTATAGAFGAVAAAGRLLGLNPERMAHALGLTATRAAGLKAQFGTMGKPYNAGIAAQTGVEVARLVAAGFESNPSALEGPLGFGAMHHGAGHEAEALDGLGENWLFESVSHKFHACCHGLHAALEALGSLDLPASGVEAIEVETHPRWMTVCNQPEPATGLGAKFSYRVALAMLSLGHDTARLDSYTDALCSEPDLVALRDRILVREDAGLAETEARVRVRLDGGTLREAVHDLDAPMPLEMRAARVRAKAVSLIGEATVAEVEDLLDSSGQASGLGQLLAN